MRRHALALALELGCAVILVIPAVAAAGCAEVEAVLAGRAVDVVCFESPDLTTNNTSGPPTGPTTPGDNSLPGLPVGAFTPQTDRAIVTDVPTPIAKAVPGLQVQGRFADDPAGQARFLLRLPHFVDLPLMLKQFPLYVASGFNPASAAAQAIRTAGYPPDIISGGLSFWLVHYLNFYEVTMCQWQKRFDPAYDTYVAGLANYDYAARVAASNVEDQLAEVEPTGKIKRPLVTVAGTMDALLPAGRHARVYAGKVVASRKGSTDGHRHAQYRLWEIQNGNHVDSLKAFFPQLERIMPHAQHAFDLLVEHVEKGAVLPPSQCVPTGGAISATPAQPGLCAQLLVP
jgi:3HB-oligomer hydrolase (3HBOH)